MSSSIPMVSSPKPIRMTLAGRRLPALFVGEERRREHSQRPRRER
jgi:hypothetical protein